MGSGDSGGSDYLGESGHSGNFFEFVDFSECGDSGGSDELGPGESDDQKIYGLYGVKCHS